MQILAGAGPTNEAMVAEFQQVIDAYENRVVKVCSAGTWKTSAVEYCYACGIGTCGDGGLNCGETKERSSQRTKCSANSCPN